MGKRIGPQDQASFGYKFRQFVRSLPKPYTHEDMALLASIQRPTLTKWANEGDPAKMPEHDWVLRLVRAVEAPDVLVDWLRNGRPVSMPVSPGAVPAQGIPDPLRDVITGRFEKLECLTWSAPSEWSAKGKKQSQIEIPASLMREGGIGLPLDGLDNSMRDLAEQGHVLLAYPIDRAAKTGDLIIARKKDRVVARVLRYGADGYELDFVGRNEKAIPAEDWEIAFLPVAVIRHVEPGRLNIDFRPGGFQF